MKLFCYQCHPDQKYLTQTVTLQPDLFGMCGKCKRRDVDLYEDKRFHVYVAAKFEDRIWLKWLREKLQERGVVVTSRWLDYPDSPDIEKDWPDEALKDLHDIDAADAIVCFNLEHMRGMTRGGRHVEFGYAIGKGKHLILVGKKENVFHFLPWVSVIDPTPKGTDPLQVDIVEEVVKLGKVIRKIDAGLMRE